MNETITKRVRFLCDGSDIVTSEKYPAGTEIELMRTEQDFDLLVAAGIVQLLED